jgi:hypothetical protein
LLKAGPIPAVNHNGDAVQGVLFPGFPGAGQGPGDVDEGLNPAPGPVDGTGEPFGLFPLARSRQGANDIRAHRIQPAAAAASA